MPSRAFYGELETDAYYCALVKGEGKVPYNPDIHRSRNTAVIVRIQPLAEQNISGNVQREMIAESSEYIDIVWSSLKELGITNLREASGKWIRAEQVPSGRKYTDRNTGETREATTFRFTALYDGEEACRAAYYADTGREPEIPSIEQAPLPTRAEVASSEELAKAIPFIKAFAKQKNYDLEATKKMCATQVMISRAIDVESPEFAAIVAEAATEAK